MKKKLLLTALFGILTFTSCTGGNIPSSSEEGSLETPSQVESETQTSEESSSTEEESSFPSEEIKAFFNVDDVPPSFSGDEFFFESDSTQGYECFIVYTLKNEGASNEYFSTYLVNLGYQTPVYESSEDYYYAESTSTLPYTILFYEQDAEGSTYFVAQYYYDGTSQGGDTNEDGFYVTSTFPDAQIKSFFSATTSLVGFNASEYYYVETVDGQGYDCFFIYSTSSEINASDYATLLTNAGYTVDQYEDETGPYYDGYSEVTGYEVLFWDDASDNSLNLQIYYFGETGDGGDTGGDEGEELEYQELTSFPSSQIASWLGVNSTLPSYQADKYFYLEYDFYGLLNVAFVYSDLSETACNDAYAQILTNAGYTVELITDETGSYYGAYNEAAGYEVYFYEDETKFTIEAYAYMDDDSSDVGGDTGNDEFVAATSFPSEQIKSFFSATTSLVSYETSEVYYVETTDDAGDACFFMYSYDNSVDASSYGTLLTNAGYTVEEYEDEDGPYYYAYNESTGYELLYWDDASDNSLNLQIYYFGETGDSGNGGDSGNENIGESISLDASNFPSSYGAYSFTVNGVTFESDYIMKSTSYTGSFQWKKNLGVLYNTTPLSNMSTLVITLNDASTYNITITVYGGSSKDNCSTEISGIEVDGVYTYDISGYDYIKICNTGNALYLDSIVIA